MIGESAYYTEELATLASALRRWDKRKRLSELDYFRIERSLFYGAFIVRKLMEARKVVDKLSGKSFRLWSMPNVKRVTTANWHRIEENYDQENASAIRLTARFICNQLIHSYVFMIAAAPGHAHVFFCSDKERNRRLFSMRLLELARLFETVSRSRARWISGILNEETGDYDLFVS
jgi:hypothetical protein